jgi:hypothetical protein
MNEAPRRGRFARSSECDAFDGRRVRGAVGGRGDPVRAAEARRERPDAAQPDQQADVCDRAIGVAEQRRGALQPAGEEVVVGRLAERPAELAAEVRL